MDTPVQYLTIFMNICKQLTNDHDAMFCNLISFLVEPQVHKHVHIFGDNNYKKS